MLTISPQWLSAVRIGTTVSQVQAGARFTFDVTGDGLHDRESILPGLEPHVGAMTPSAVPALRWGPRPGSVKQAVETREGFELGLRVR